MSEIDLSRIPDMTDPAVVAALRASGVLRRPGTRRSPFAPARDLPPEYRKSMKAAAVEYLAQVAKNGKQWGQGKLIAEKYGIRVSDLHQAVNKERERKIARNG